MIAMALLKNVYLESLIPRPYLIVMLTHIFVHLPIHLITHIFLPDLSILTLRTDPHHMVKRQLSNAIILSVKTPKTFAKPSSAIMNNTQNTMKLTFSDGSIVLLRCGVVLLPCVDFPAPLGLAT